MIKKIRDYFSSFGIYAFRIIKYIFILKLHKIKNTNKITHIKNYKTGSKPFYIRPYTTDLKIVKKILIKNGEYDFIYDKEYINFIKNSKVIIDAGSNIGVFSRMIHELNSSAKIIAIEPETNNFNILNKNIDESYICLKKGLFNEKCNLKVNSSPGGEWGFTVSKTKDGEEYDIEAISINDIIKEYKIKEIDLIKIDIEGSEYYVFDNTSDSWLKKTKMVIIEFHDRTIPGCSKRVLDKMEKLEFKHKIYNENYFFYK